jgi:hypothetical protein
MGVLFWEYLDSFVTIMNMNAVDRAKQFINETKVWHVLPLIFGYYAVVILCAWLDMSRENNLIEARFNRIPDDWS